MSLLEKESLKISLLCVFYLEIHKPNEILTDLVSAKNFKKIRGYS